MSSNIDHTLHDYWEECLLYRNRLPGATIPAPVWEQCMEANIEDSSIPLPARMKIKDLLARHIRTRNKAGGGQE